jgi:hypothetical protein
LYLVQILLPVRDNDGRPFPRSCFQAVADRLTHRFGGVTAFSRAPAEGMWSGSTALARDDIIVVEAMTSDLDRGWWRSYRHELERTFRQEAIVVRATEIEPL